MTVYTLKNSNNLKKIITHPELKPPRMELVFEGFSVFSEEEDIIQKIKDILKLKYITTELAEIISKEFSDLFEKKESISPKFENPTPTKEIKNPNEIPYIRPETYFLKKLDYQSNFLSSQEYATRERILGGFPQTKNTSSNKKIIQPSTPPYKINTKENEQIQVAIDKSILEDNDRSLMEGILDLSRKAPTMVDLVHKEYIDEVNENFLENGKINSFHKNSFNQFFSPGTSNERLIVNAMQNNVHKKYIDKHIISEVECTFTTYKKGILLTLDCEALDIDKEQLFISYQDKKDLLNCKNMEDLISTLRTFRNGEWIANNLQPFISPDHESLSHSI